MPAGLIQHQDGMGTGGDPGGDFIKVQLHCPGIAAGHDERRANAAFRADSAEDIGRSGALIAERNGTGAALGPTTGEFGLLPDPRFVLPPDLYRGIRRESRPDTVERVGEVFLNSSRAWVS